MLEHGKIKHILENIQDGEFTVMLHNDLVIINAFTIGYTKAVSVKDTIDRKVILQIILEKDGMLTLKTRYNILDFDIILKELLRHVNKSIDCGTDIAYY